MRKRILLAGESWVSAATHYKGFDAFGSVTYHQGAAGFIAALKDEPFDIEHMPCHVAQTEFPSTMAALDAYDAVLLSDIGANTLLLHPEVWLHSRPFPNRLRLLAEWVAKGGGLGMVGGYMSFQGINGSARFRGTAVAAALPVAIHPWDDRIEVPEGFHATVAAPGHALLQGVEGEWPMMLGLNEVVARPGATVLATGPEGHPLLAVGEHGAGRTLAWTTDIGPHWLPEAARGWPGFVPLWRNLLGWLGRVETT